jgi:hypothetical protein
VFSFQTSTFSHYRSPHSVSVMIVVSVQKCSSMPYLGVASDSARRAYSLDLDQVKA